MGGGMLMDEAGGVKTSARDVAQWVQLNLQADPTASPVLQAGIQRAQQRYAQSARRCIRAGLGNAGLPGDINSSDSRDRA